MRNIRVRNETKRELFRFKIYFFALLPSTVSCVISFSPRFAFVHQSVTQLFLTNPCDQNKKRTRLVSSTKLRIEKKNGKQQLTTRTTPNRRTMIPTTTASRGAFIATTTTNNNTKKKKQTNIFFALKKKQQQQKKNANNNDDSWSLLDEEMNRAAKNAPINENFATRRALGIDYGLSKTGLAISSGGFAPRPLESLLCKGKSRVELIREIVDVAERERADVYVVGYPRQTREELELLEEKIREVTESNAQNKENKKVPIRMHRVCEQFAEALAQVSTTAERKIPVEMYDESFTSDEAMSMKRGSLASDDPKLDSIAAALLLERYFEQTDGEPIRITPSSSSSSSWGNRNK